MTIAVDTLIRSLQDHLANPDFIKGWEVDKRTCVGPKRAPLRRAAREAKTLSGREYSTRTGPKGADWIRSIDKLRQALAAAGEADFDGLLSEALDACTAQAKTHEGEVPDAAEAAPAPMVTDAVAAAEAHLLRGTWRKPLKREYAAAQELAAEVRTAASEYAEAAALVEKKRATYAAKVDQLREELKSIGEGDFDGLLRQAVRTLRQPAATALAETPPPEEMPPPEEVPQPSTPGTVVATAEQLSPPAPPLPAPLAAAELAVAELEVREVDADGCVWLGTLPPALQAALACEAFAPGAAGVCGGLVKGQRVLGAHGQTYEPVGEASVPWGGLGLHGSHAMRWSPADGGAAGAVLAALHAAAPRLPAAARDALRRFEPSALRVSFEAMGGRSIGASGSLCGWSGDRLRGGAADGTPRLLVLLGSAESVIESFKYTKSDEESLDVPLRPGELLLLYGEARGWLSAVTGFTPALSSKADAGAGLGVPFDFAHLSLLDLRQYEKSKPKEFGALLTPPRPSPRDSSYRWMQNTYTVQTPGTVEDGRVVAPPTVELRGKKP